MEKKLTLHIGLEKTGTTSIQAFLAAHRARFLQNGILVPAIFSKKNSPELYVSATEKGHEDKLTRIFFSNNEYAKEAMQHALCLTLRQLARKKHVNHIILSSELLQSRLHTVAEIHRLKTMVLSAFEHIDVVLYIRNQSELLVGMTQQKVQAGGYCADFMTYAHPFFDNACDHQQTFLRWDSVFPNSVIVRIFDKASLKEGDVIDDFLDATGLTGLASGWERKHRLNESWSVDKFQKLNYLNQVGARGLNKQQMTRILAVQTNQQSAVKLRPSTQFHAKCIDHYQLSNEWVRKRFFPSSKQLFSTPRTTDIHHFFLPCPEVRAIIDSELQEFQRPGFCLKSTIKQTLKIDPLRSIVFRIRLIQSLSAKVVFGDFAYVVMIRLRGVLEGVRCDIAFLARFLYKNEN